MAFAAVHKAPQVSAAAAAVVARNVFGCECGVEPLRRLGSQQDALFVVPTSSTGDRGPCILKFSNVSVTRGSIEMQNAAMMHVHRRRPSLPVPVPLPALDGSLITLDVQSGLFVRLLTFVDGSTLTGLTYLAPCVRADLGRVSGSVAVALSDFYHRRSDTIEPRFVGQWNLACGEEVVAAFLSSIQPPEHAEAVATAASAAMARVRALEPMLRVQIIHGDITDDNCVGVADAAGRIRPHGAIDFGDVCHSWLICELAVTLSSVLRNLEPGREPIAAVLPTVIAFNREMILHDAEIAALWPLVVLRACVLVACGRHQAAIDAENPTAHESLESEWHIFSTAVRVPLRVAETMIRRALFTQYNGTEVAVHELLSASSPLLWCAPQVVTHDEALEQLPEPSALMDFSCESLVLDELGPGAFLRGDQAELEALRRAVTTAYPHTDRAWACTRWGEARITRSRGTSASEPATAALCVDVLVPACGVFICSPWSGHCCDYSTESAVDLAFTTHIADASLTVKLSVRHLNSSACESSRQLSTMMKVAVGSGGPVKRVTGGALLRVQLIVGATSCEEPSKEAEEAAHDPPAFVVPTAAHGWAALSPNPSVLLGIPQYSMKDTYCPHAATADADADKCAALRVAHFASLQSHYYNLPPRIERGWQTYLYDTTGRAYLDSVNNVASVGHSHPGVADAVARQVRLLNTNSRFNYKAVADFTTRLAALAPPTLDSILLVNSGSEAIDLALRIARTVTGRETIVSLAEAYHGVTFLSDAVTSEYTGALLTRPSFVTLLDAPRSKIRPLRSGASSIDDQVHADAACHTIAGLALAGRAPAAFICEPLLGNSGGVELPRQYLMRVWAAARAAGALCICDEVQVGLGRTGATFWAHEAEGAGTPDIICTAKALGNGFPIGAVITTHAIAAAFRERCGSFFSSSGGSPASCVAGLAVLNAIHTEGLQSNAARVGAHLRASLQRLVDESDAMARRQDAASPIVKSSHGRPLFPLVGAVHGRGLYLGIELVRDMLTFEPAAAEADAVCDRLLDRGIICQTASVRGNVLKLKPPMTISISDADHFVAQLEHVLRTGF